MSGNEIREKIIENNKIIEEANPTIFVLNKKVQKALDDNRHLRSICPHEYDETGYCIYCDAAAELN